MSKIKTLNKIKNEIVKRTNANELNRMKETQ